MKGSAQSTHLVEMFVEKKAIFIVMSFEGESNLKQYLADQPYLTVIFRRAPSNRSKLLKKRTIALNVAAALAECHRRGVVHRDVKLENVMIRPDLTVCLIDFGYGRVLRHADEQLNKYCGTPYYMPPEIIQRAGYDGRERRADRQAGRRTPGRSGSSISKF